MAHDVFISYSQADKAVADAVCHRMEAAGIRCWIAPRDIAHGKTWDNAVVDAVTAAEVVVVIFSASANASRHVLDEVAAALNAGATVIPFRIEDIAPTGALLLHLGRVHWLDALSSPWEPHIDRVIESVSRNLPQSPERAARDGGEAGPKQETAPTGVEKQEASAWRWRWITPLAVVLIVVAAGALLWWQPWQSSDHVAIIRTEHPPAPPIPERNGSQRGRRFALY